MLLLLSMAAPLLISPTLVSAFCSTFTTSGSPYVHQDLDQSQTVSPGIICNSTYSMLYTAWNTTSNSTTYTGCHVVPSISYIHASGTTNLTSLSAADEASLFALVGAQANFTGYDFPRVGFLQSMAGCIDQYIADPNPFVLYGTNGVMQVHPQLNCVNGTLSGCGGASVADGTAVSICGVSNETTAPLVVGRFLNTSLEYAQSVTTNPSANATCTKLLSSGAVAERGVGLLMVVSALAMGWLLSV